MDIKYLDIEHFVEEGYLQELNRQFLHPLGLALVVGVETDDDTGEPNGPWHLVGIWDCREDPEGVNFAEDVLELEKAERVQEAQTARYDQRVAGLGYWVQPLPRPGEEGT